MIDGFQVICLMRASGAVTRNFSAMLPDFTECFIRLPLLSCMLLLATTTLAFTTCMTTFTQFLTQSDNAGVVEQVIKLLNGIVLFGTCVHSYCFGLSLHLALMLGW